MPIDPKMLRDGERYFRAAYESNFTPEELAEQRMRAESEAGWSQMAKDIRADRQQYKPQLTLKPPTMNPARDGFNVGKSLFDYVRHIDPSKALLSLMGIQ